MYRFMSVVLLAVTLSTGTAQAAGSGLVQKKSPYTVSETINRLENILKKKGITVMARVNHAANAGKVGMTLRPTELLIFGNPKQGTLLMAEKQEVAIDLPMKALSWKDANGQVWIGYERPEAIAKRRGLAMGNKVIQGTAKALDALTSAATKR